MFFKTQIKKVDTFSAVDVAGRRLTFIGNLPCQAGDFVWTDGKVIFGNIQPQATPFFFSGYNHTIIPVLSKNLCGYFDLDGKFKAVPRWLNIINSDRIKDYTRIIVGQKNIFLCDYAFRGEYGERYPDSGNNYLLNPAPPSYSAVTDSNDLYITNDECISWSVNEEYDTPTARFFVYKGFDRIVFFHNQEKIKEWSYNDITNKIGMPLFYYMKSKYGYDYMGSFSLRIQCVSVDKLGNITFIIEGSRRYYPTGGRMSLFFGFLCRNEISFGNLETLYEYRIMTEPLTSDIEIPFQKLVPIHDGFQIKRVLGINNYTDNYWFKTTALYNSEGEKLFDMPQKINWLTSIAQLNDGSYLALNNGASHYWGTNSTTLLGDFSGYLYKIKKGVVQEEYKLERPYMVALQKMTKVPKSLKNLYLNDK